jgi:hypothetical protein
VNDRDIILVGDFNIDLQGVNGIVCDYLNVLAYHGFVSAINEGTSNNSCLDHIMIKSGNFARGVVCHTAITDHFPVLVGMRSEHLTGEKSDKKLVRRINYDQLKEDMRDQDWDDVYGSTCVNDSYEELCNIVTRLIKKNEHIKTMRSRNLKMKEWITEGIINSIRRRDKLHLQCIRNPEDAVLNAHYRKYRNTCSKLLKKSKSMYYEKQIDDSKSDSKECWKIIREYTNSETKKQPGIYKLMEGCRDNQSTKKRLNESNEYFASIGKNLAQKKLKDISKNNEILNCDANIPSPAGSIFLSPTDEHEVLRVISTIKKDSSPGIDNIDAKLLHIC